MWDDAERKLEHDRERQALSQLRSARGEQHAAVVVAVLAYRVEYIDGLTGGQRRDPGRFPELYDQAQGGTKPYRSGSRHESPNRRQ